MALPKHLQEAVQQALAQHFGRNIAIHGFESVSGGCINNGGKLTTAAGDFFLKWNTSDHEGMFETEVKGLRLLHAAGELRVPEPLLTGEADPHLFLLMEWIKPGERQPDFWEDFGQRLARLHRHTQEHYGLDFDNYIGSLPQRNREHELWKDFFLQERIFPQVERAQQQGYLSQHEMKQVERLEERLADFFPPEPASLLHGDLWSGNFLVDEHGQAAIIDPAVYYGHREMELAFTRLFGGYDARFYAAYEEEWPLQPGFPEREEVYNLYPLLVHLNLFGTGYLGQVQAILRRF